MKKNEQNEKVAIIKGGQKVAVSNTVYNTYRHDADADRERKRVARAKAAGRPIPVSSSLEEMYENMGTQVPSDADVFEEVAQKILVEQLRKAVRELPADLRNTVVLYYFNGLTCQEAADELGLPCSTFKDRLKKAKNALKEKLENFVKF